MADLKCRKCGREASYADANIGDLRKTCGEGNDGVPAEIEGDGGQIKYAYGGEKHDWTEV